MVEETIKEVKFKLIIFIVIQKIGYQLKVVPPIVVRTKVAQTKVAPNQSWPSQSCPGPKLPQPKVAPAQSCPFSNVIKRHL